MKRYCKFALCLLYIAFIAWVVLSFVEVVAFNTTTATYSNINALTLIPKIYSNLPH